MVQGAKGPRDKESWLKFLAGNRLAIYSLIAICLVTLVGTIIPQRGPGLTEAQYQKLAESGGIWTLAAQLGLLDIFRSPWFIGAFAILCVNLIFCTLIRFRKILKARTPADLEPGPELFEKLDRSFTFKTKDADKTRIRASLAAFQNIFRSPWFLGEVLIFCVSLVLVAFGGLWSTFVAFWFLGAVGVIGLQLVNAALGIRREAAEGDDNYFYSESGGLHRYGAIICHLALLVIAVGAIYGILLGFDGNMGIAEGEKSNVVSMRRGNKSFKLPFDVRCDDFTVEFYPNSRRPKTFRSNITFLPKDGADPSTQKIEVNIPGRFGGYRFFQSTYGQLPPQATISIRRRGEEKVLQQISLAPGHAARLPDNAGRFMIVDMEADRIGMGLAARIIEQLNGKVQQEFWLFKSTPSFDESRGGDFVYSLLDVNNEAYYTGLSVARNPGVNVVWLGSALMALGIGLAFFVPHKKVLIRLAKGQVTVAGRHSGGVDELDRYLNELVEKLGGKSRRGKNKDRPRN